MGDDSRITFGNIAGGIHDSKFAGRDIVEIVIQLVQQTGGQMPSPRNLPAQAAALRQALPLLDPAARAPVQTALDHLAQAIADLPRCEQAYLDRLKDRYAQEASYYIPLSGQTTETLPASSSAHTSRAARRRAHRTEAEYREWIVAEQEIKPAGLAEQSNHLPYATEQEIKPARLAEQNHLPYQEWIVTEQEIKQVKLNTLREGVDKYSCLILLGDPGCGKTTALEHLAYEFAVTTPSPTPLAHLRGGGSSSPLPLRSPAPLLPLPLRLSDFTPGLTLEDWIAEGWGGSIEAGRWGAPELAANLEGYLEAGRLFFLFDALNEMPRDGYREHAAALRRFIDCWRAKGNRFLVTCRVLDYGEELSGLQRIEIQPLNDKQIRTFLQNELPNHWQTLWHTLTDSPPLARGGVGGGVEPRRLLELARNPYLLTMMIDIFLEDGQLGQNRADLLTRFTHILLAREKAKCPPAEWLDAAAQRESLAVLAFEMQQRAGSGAAVETALVKTVLPPQVQIDPKWPPIPAPPDQVLTLAARANLIEMPVDRSSVRFYHQVLQEYFAARQLLKQVDLTGLADLSGLEKLWRWPWLETEMPRWVRPEGNYDPLPPPPPTGWEETTILAAGLAAENDDQLVQTLIRVNPVLAGRCLHEGKARVDQAVRQAVIQSLISNLSDPEVALRVRIAAGEVLGYLGDPRLGEMVTIPAGKFLIENNYDPQASPPCEIFLAVYQFAKYPVTNVEFRQFVEAGGYSNKRWWTEAGWMEKEKRQWIEPRWWHDPEFNKPNQPIIGVNWYECVAYCRWLSAETEILRRLPTEMEWERATRGFGEQQYLWDNEFETNRLNVAKSEQVMNVTPPVGIYPRGVSPFGVFDCTNNVWEWCTTKRPDFSLRSYPSNLIDDEWSPTYLEGTDVRALQCGSSNLDVYDARCAFRYSRLRNPISSGLNIGFRVAASFIG